MIAIRDGNLNDWLNQTVSSSTNSNVFFYYDAFDNLEQYRDLYYPYRQLEAGFPFDEIKCRDNLELIFKFLDGSPACVTSETKTKLIERGWAKPT